MATGGVAACRPYWPGVQVQYKHIYKYTTLIYLTISFIGYKPKERAPSVAKSFEAPSTLPVNELDKSLQKERLAERISNLQATVKPW